MFGQTHTMGSDSIAPSDFYTGIVADLYRHFRSMTFDPKPYVRFVESSGEPALELGCGDGDPLLDLRSLGLDVEGLDSSPDMLKRCRRAAEERDLDVALHHATFERMDLDMHFRSIYFAGPTFNLLPDDEAAQTALTRIAAHLHPEGSALIPLFIPQLPAASSIGGLKEHVTADGRVMRLTVLDIERDEAARNHTTELRYELVTGDDHQVADRSWRLHWYDQEGFAAMAARAGLTTKAVQGLDGNAATSDATVFTFLLAPQT